MDKHHPMPVSARRPVFLDLRRIALPMAGLMSILHRLSGLLLFLALPWTIWLLGLSLEGPAGLARALALLHGLPGGLALLALLWALLHHLLAGVRYLLIDVHLGVDRPAYRQSARAVVVAAPLLAALLTGLLL